jgi:hypothetical protein
MLLKAGAGSNISAWAIKKMKRGMPLHYIHNEMPLKSYLWLILR